MSRKYTPRRASKKWLEGAPDYILDCFDNGGKTCDRYTILFGGKFIEEYNRTVRVVSYLGMCSNPDSPQGFSSWGVCPSTYRPSRDRVRWLGLPVEIREHIIMRAGG